MKQLKTFADKIKRNKSIAISRKFTGHSVESELTELMADDELAIVYYIANIVLLE